MATPLPKRTDPPHTEDLSPTAAPTVEKPGGNGGDDGMKELTRRVGNLEEDMKSLVKEVHEIKGRLTNMPTTFQMTTWFVGVALALVGFTFTIARVMT